MRELTAKAMEDGALGVASALIYQPGSYANTDELIALAEVAAKYKGIYISHIRNEGDHEMEAIDELITIAREARIPAEIYHLKVCRREKLEPSAGSNSEDRSSPGRGAQDYGGHVHAIPPAPPASMPPCRRGCRKAVSKHGANGCKIRPSGNA